MRCCCPVCEGTDLVAVRYALGDTLDSGPFGIPAPHGPGVDPADIDIVVVPGLAFTVDGHRLGQGGGFYDRFLPRLRADCLTVGLGFREQIIDFVPTDEHDRTLSHVISESVTE